MTTKATPAAQIDFLDHAKSNMKFWKDEKRCLLFALPTPSVTATRCYLSLTTKRCGMSERTSSTADRFALRAAEMLKTNLPDC